MRLFGLEIRRANRNFDAKGLPINVTCLHPELKTVTEFAFEINGKEYYQFKNMLDMPKPRYEKAMEFISEADMRMTVEDLIKLIEISLDAINKGSVTKSVIFQNAILSMASQYLNTDTFYRLFTCLFFDLEEEVIDYDYDYNEEKLAAFKSQPATSFFFTKPMSDYLPQIDISPQDLEVFSKQTKATSQYIQKIVSDYENGE